MIVIDFETRSRVDLRKTGIGPYARDESTEVLCVAYSLPYEDKVYLWMKGDPAPKNLFRAILVGDTIHAHNVGFERNIWKHICHARMGWPEVMDEQWRCSMAECCAVGLPRSLAMAGMALMLARQKDDGGHRLMLKMCKPRKPTKNNPSEWVDDEESMERLGDYCVQDVIAEQAVISAIPRLTNSELKVWQLDQKINEAGIKIDREAIENALAIVDQQYAFCCDRIRHLTDGEVKTPKQVAAIRTWLMKHAFVDLPDLSKATITETLKEDLPQVAREILEVRLEASLASTAKLKAMLLRCDEDDRVRSNLVYHGAGTGRWSGSGIQVQNFPRGGMSPEDIDQLHRVLPKRSARALDLLFGSPAECVSSSLRSMLIAEPGHRLMACDFASIEARVLAWIAGQHDLLRTFREGGDVYIEMASKIYDVISEDVTKHQRSIGKMAILGLGYGMGHKAFRRACKTMAGVSITNRFAKKVVKKYREANGNIRQLWKDLGSAVIRAVETRQPHSIGRFKMLSDGEWLTIELPSKRKVHYRRPSLIEVVAPWSLGHEGTITAPEDREEDLEDLDVSLGERVGDHWDGCFVPKGMLEDVLAIADADVDECEPKMIQQLQYWSVNSTSRKWGSTRTYGAKLVENITQAIARDLLAEAMLRLDRAGYPLIATIHDEVLCEVPDDFGSLDSLTEIMEQVPAWASGCPIGAEGFEAARYRK